MSTFQVFFSVCRRARPSSRTSLSVGSTGSGNSSSPAASASAISAAVHADHMSAYMRAHWFGAVRDR